MMAEAKPNRSFTPPLSLAWRTDQGYTVVAVGSDAFYGIRPDGTAVASNLADGSQRWESSGVYLTSHIVCSGSRVFAYVKNQGFGYIDDNGHSPDEHLVLSFGASPDAHIARPVLDDDMVYLAVNQGLYAWHQTQGLQYNAVLSRFVPHTVGRISAREIVVIDGHGIPTRLRATAGGFQQVWVGEQHGIDAGQIERPFAISGQTLVVGVGPQTVAYDLTTGRIAWRLGLPAQTFAVNANQVFGGFLGASVWAARLDNGGLLWQRQYMYDTGLQLDYGVALHDGHLYFGGGLTTNPDRRMLMAFAGDTGDAVWHSRSAARQWAGGIPVETPQGLLVYDNAQSGLYAGLTALPTITAAQISVSPRPLRGAASAFGTGEIAITVGSTARVTIALYREREGLGTVLANGVNWARGDHQVAWNPGGSGGYTGTKQFGFVLVDVDEGAGQPYTQAMLVPVNAFPDIMGHWARSNIETMTYLKYVNGYLDQTFKPDNLVTRAESSTIIAKTLNLQGPSPNFQTHFTDIAQHWARSFIMALEERGVVGGFAEPDGTFTFRPELNMTRAQEARILVRAFSIPDAPASFTSAFRDIAGHWAEKDIKALEAAGYVTGFREPDGSFTFRPEQNLTRAELCTVVVRVLQLAP